MTSAAASSSGAPTTTSSSAWSRLVQITRVASNNSRSQSVELSKSPAKASSIPSQEPTSTRPAKRRRLENSSPTQSTITDSHKSTSQSSTTHALPTQRHELRTFYPSAGSAECTIACSCQVEDVECLAPLRLKRKPSVQAPRVNLRALWPSPRNGGALKRQAQSEALTLEPAGDDSGPDEPHPTAQQLLGSPARSYDSISDADIGDCEDGRDLKLHRGTAPSGSQPHQDAEERSIHEIGAVFAAKRKQVLSKSDPPARKNVSRQPSESDLVHDQHETSGSASTELEVGQQGQDERSGHDRPSIMQTGLCKVRSNSLHAEFAGIEAGIVPEPVPTCVPAILREMSQPEGSRLQDSDQNSLNKTPKSDRRHDNPIVRGDENQLITPSTSPTSGSETNPDENKDDEQIPQGMGPAAKVKRRLNLHSSSYAGQPSKKKRKTPPKKQVAVQTTLSLAIGGSAGMRECKVCDTVYNPFHPEDAKVHAKRHAVVLKNGAGVC